MDDIQCREDILVILFPKKPEGSEVNAITELEISEPSCVNFPSCSTVQGNTVEHYSSSDLRPDQGIQLSESENEWSDLQMSVQGNTVEHHSSSDLLPDQGIQLSESENEWSDLQMSYKTLWDTFDALKSGKKRKNWNAKNFASTRPKLKMKVEQSIRVLDAAVKKWTHCNSPGDEDKSLADDAENMLGELKQLSTALNVSGKELEQNFTLIRELLGKLRARKSRLKPWLDSLFIPSDTKTPATDSFSQVIVTLGTHKNKNKGKDNQKSKKGKHGKGKRNR